MEYRDDVFQAIWPDQRVEIPIKFLKRKPYPVPSRSLSQSQSHHRTASALKIQKVFRGFLVRKSVKKLIAIKRDVDEVERMMISDVEIFDWIRIDRREGLRVIEKLMNLLFKLDSVRGVNTVIKDCRKSVANKALALQDFIDAANPTVYQTETRTPGEREDNSQRNSESAAQTLESIATCGQYSVGQIDETDGFNFDNSRSQCRSEYDDEGAGICVDENCEDNSQGNSESAAQTLESMSTDGQHSVGQIDETLTEGGAVMEKDASISPVEESEVDLLQEIIEELCKNHQRQTKTLNNLVGRVLHLEKFRRTRSSD